jgi:hypothetical protein
MSTEHADPRLEQCLARWDGHLSSDASRYCFDLEHYLINRVQAYIFKFQYRREARDYWKTPTEFLTDLEGDCEDFAICAGAMLRRVMPHLGMWLVICREVCIKHRAHAVLRVQLSDDTMLYLNNKYALPSTEKAFTLEYMVVSVTSWPSLYDVVASAEPPHYGAALPPLSQENGENQ